MSRHRLKHKQLAVRPAPPCEAALPSTCRSGTCRRQQGHRANRGDEVTPRRADTNLALNQGLQHCRSWHVGWLN